MVIVKLPPTASSVRRTGSTAAKHFRYYSVPNSRKRTQRNFPDPMARVEIPSGVRASPLRRTTMRLKYLALLAIVGFILTPAPAAHAQISFGIDIGGGYADVPPVVSTATTHTRLMPAHPMATMARSGSTAASSSAPAPGTITVGGTRLSWRLGSRPWRLGRRSWLRRWWLPRRWWRLPRWRRWLPRRRWRPRWRRTSLSLKFAQH